MHNRLGHAWKSLFVAALCTIVGCADADEQHPPLSTEAALRSFEIDDRFQIELFAAEPLVSDPVAMDIDEDGRIYVAEDHGYPEYRPYASEIKLLEDSDGDGRLDKSTTFADSLVSPRGVMRWKKGLLVTDAPDVLYFEDTDGDGRADIRRVVLTGFGTDNPQRGVNNPIFGLDNWIYLGHGGPETSLSWGDQRRDSLPDVRRRNLRIRPETREIEATAVRTQFGHTFDAWGRHLHATNANHLYREAIAARYLLRNPSLVISSARDMLPDHGEAAEIFPITENPEHQLFTDVGVITSACGITCYTGGGFPDEFEGATFVAEPTHNLVHVDVLEGNASSFTARRMYEDREFLASRDSWFRPVNFYVGPDGALYVLDYYRGIIEQPKFLTDDALNPEALYGGADRGRIYRIVPRGASSAAWLDTLQLSNAPSERLVSMLSSPNIWQRRTAQRLILDRNDPDIAVHLGRAARDAERPEGRLHALWALEGLGELKESTLAEALGDPSPGVRENAIRLAELHLRDMPGLQTRLVGLDDEDDPHVRYQLLLSLGELDSPEAVALREKLLFENIDDPWMQTAALTARDLDAALLLERATARASGPMSRGDESFYERLGAMAASDGRSSTVQTVLRRVLSGGDAPRRAAVMRGVASASSDSKRLTTGVTDLRSRLFEIFRYEQDAGLRTAAAELLSVTGLDSPTRARVLREMASDQTEDAEIRAAAIGLLERLDATANADLFERLMVPSEPLSVQEAALDGLGGIDGGRAGQFLVERWPRLHTALRPQALDVIIRNNAAISHLLDAVESGEIPPSSFEWTRRKRLMMNSDPALRARARQLLAPEEPDDIIEKYRSSLAIDGDAEQGRLLFASLCSSCHEVGGRGASDFGPDLAGIRGRRPEFILTDILAPNREIVTGYEQWQVELKGGRTLVGIIAEETPTSITFRRMGGEPEVLARESIVSMESTGESAMPRGFEHLLDQQQMADLLAFLTDDHQRTSSAEGTP